MNTVKPAQNAAGGAGLPADLPGESVVDVPHGERETADGIFILLPVQKIIFIASGKLKAHIVMAVAEAGVKIQVMGQVLAVNLGITPLGDGLVPEIEQRVTSIKTGVPFVELLFQSQHTRGLRGGQRRLGRLCGGDQSGEPLPDTVGVRPLRIILQIHFIFALRVGQLSVAFAGQAEKFLRLLPNGAFGIAQDLGIQLNGPAVILVGHFLFRLLHQRRELFILRDNIFDGFFNGRRYRFGNPERLNIHDHRTQVHTAFDGKSDLLGKGEGDTRRLRVTALKDNFRDGYPGRVIPKQLLALAQFIQLLRG